jgi:dynein heavy chain
LIVLKEDDTNFITAIENAVSNGDTVLVEDIDESLGAVLDPLLNRILIRKGKCVKIGDKEIDFNPNFKLILQTNPYYKPEMQAQTTLINFTGKQNYKDD